MKKNWAKTLLFILVTTTCFLSITPPSNTGQDLSASSKAIILNLYSHGFGA